MKSAARSAGSSFDPRRAFRLLLLVGAAIFAVSLPASLDVLIDLARGLAHSLFH